MKRLSIGKLFRIGGIGGFEIRRKRGVRLLLLLLLFASCAKDSAQPEQPDSATTGRTIRKEVTVQVAPMQGSVGKDATRATTPLSEDEATIYSLWVLQFAGTADGSLLVKKDPVTVSEITDGAFYFDFEELSGGGQITVYLLANMESTALDGVTENSTTLGTFKASNLGVTPLTAATMKTGGLPMIASQSFDYATSNPAAFALKSLLAKVSFQYTTAGGFTFTGVNLYAKNLASAVPVTEPAAGASVQHPAGIAYTGSLTLVGDATYAPDTETVCYLPENLAGQVAAITQDKDRGGSNVPAGAVYMNMQDNTLSPIAYSFYPGDGTASDFNLQRHHQYTFNMELKGMNFTDKRVTIDTANCFLVDADNTAYSFLATVMGNGVTTPSGPNAPEILPTALEPTRAVVLWEQSDPTNSASNRAGDVVKYVHFSNVGYIHFTTGTQSGNAVIAALDRGGNIIWSWHIWRPETNPGDVECYTPYPIGTGRTFTMMGLNLGAFNNEPDKVKAYGLLYQWGRKDPFPNATQVQYKDGGSATFEGVVTENGYSFAAVGKQVTTQVAIENPLNFYHPNLDWTSWQDNLWGNLFLSGNIPNPSLGSKSIYDPCPYGYRVPPQDTWEQATTSNWDTNGQRLSVGTGGATYFYPACGLRIAGSGAGKLASVGSQGCYWSSSPATSQLNKKAGSLSFSSKSVKPENDDVRSLGMSVRCMKEE